MRFIKKIELLTRIDRLIRMKATGPSKQLAMRTGVSKSTIYEILEILKEMGADIEYCGQRKSFYYTSNKTLAIGYIHNQEFLKSFSSPEKSEK